jgi:hypothetical protein
MKGQGNIDTVKEIQLGLTMLGVTKAKAKWGVCQYQKIDINKLALKEGV